MTPLKKVLFHLKFELEQIIFFWVGEGWKECFTYRSLFNYAFRILIFSVICIDVFFKQWVVYKQLTTKKGIYCYHYSCYRKKVGIINEVGVHQEILKVQGYAEFSGEK